MQEAGKKKDQNGLASLPGPAIGGRGIGQHPIHPHRIGDVLDLLVSERLIAANELVLDLLIDAARDMKASPGTAIFSRRVAMLTPSPYTSSAPRQ